MKRNQLMISFGVHDEDVYNFLKQEKNASGLIRAMVREYMRNGNISSMPVLEKSVAKPVVQEQVKKAEEVKEVEYETKASNKILMPDL